MCVCACVFVCVRPSEVTHASLIACVVKFAHVKRRRIFCKWIFLEYHSTFIAPWSLWRWILFNIRSSLVLLCHWMLQWVGFVFSRFTHIQNRGITRTRLFRVIFKLIANPHKVRTKTHAVKDNYLRHLGVLRKWIPVIPASGDLCHYFAPKILKWYITVGFTALSTCF